MRVATWAFVVASTTAACSTAPSEDGGPPPGEGAVLEDGTIFTRRALLEAIGTCVLENASTLDERALALEQAVSAAEDDPSLLPAARDRWAEVMETLQRLEPMQLGPGAPSTQPGGKDLRDKMYSWPLTSPCAVDAHLPGEDYDTRPDDVLINARGLGALEYLLFEEATTNACLASHPLNADGVWSTLSAETIRERRAAYAVFVARDVTEWTRALVSAWDPEQGNFAGELALAGSSSKTFTRDSLALNAASDALFYVEWATKDLKVARPAGITQCEAATCPDTLESLYAHRSKSHVRDNLVGFRMAFAGCSEDGAGLGFDDFLYAIGQGPVGREIVEDATAAIAALDAIEEDDLADAIASDRASVVDLHAALKRITDALRTDFLTLLDLELPRRVEGDND